jgi:hypothetical protein
MHYKILKCAIDYCFAQNFVLLSLLASLQVSGLENFLTNSIAMQVGEGWQDGFLQGGCARFYEPNHVQAAGT